MKCTDNDNNPAPGKAGQTLDELRTSIDQVDAELCAALQRRAALSLAVGRLKAQSNAPVFRPEREAHLLDKLVQGNSGPLPNEHLVAIYREILSSSRALQRPQRVACLGPEGTFSHMAAQEYLGQSNNFVLMNSLGAVFNAVQKGECELGLVPIENSLNGTVGQSLDYFARHTEIFIQAEWFSRIRLSLLSRETELARLGVVYSHPQPLGQSAEWLREHLPSVAQISLDSTAAAALRVLDEPGSAAIGDARLAGQLGLNILASNIEDQADNWTRFFVIGHGEVPVAKGDTAEKSSIMFVVRDTPGSLGKVLDTFAASGINLSKLESRPMRGERWKYIFFADLDCDINASGNVPAMQAAAQHCLSARVLGTYPAGGHIHAVS